MNEEEARQACQQAWSKVDWLNFARVLQSLGDHNLDWRKYDNNYFRPEFNKAEDDIKYLKEAMDNLAEAMLWLKANPSGKTGQQTKRNPDKK